ncbi:MAG: CRISPR-associated endonuclease Cas1 [Bacillota bacterium]
MPEEHVLITEFGSFLGKKSERLVLKVRGEVVREIPFHDVERVTITTSGATLSSDMIFSCMEQGIEVDFLTGTGRPVAKISSPTLSATVATRRAQILAYEDARGVHIAKAVVEGKLRNQAAVIRYFAKHRRADPQLHGELMDGARDVEAHRHELQSLAGERVDDIRGQLLSVEGRAAQKYWKLVGKLVGHKVGFDGREHQGADDPFNSFLNYGYGILYTQAWSALLLAGLEPFAGFLHVDRPGKPSLVLDFVEEFRQQVVDRVAIAGATRGFVPELDAGRLSPAARREVAARVLERLEALERHEGKQHRVKTILHMQARRLAVFLRGEGRYKPFVGAW